MLQTAFPDWHATIDDVIAEGDKVVHRITGRGTHKGEWMGIAPTGKQVTVTGNIIYRIESDKIVEEWFEYDVMGANAIARCCPPTGAGRGLNVQRPTLDMSAPMGQRAA